MKSFSKKNKLNNSPQGGAPVSEYRNNSPKGTNVSGSRKKEQMLSSLEKKLDKAIEEIYRIKEILRELKKESEQNNDVSVHK